MTIRAVIDRSSSALFVGGASQIGKRDPSGTTLGKSCVHLEINMIHMPELIPVFEKSSSIENLFIILSTVRNHC